MSPEKRAQLCVLRYGELQGLASRLHELAVNCRHPADRNDISQAARAVCDLASIKFAIEEIAADADPVFAVALCDIIGKEAH